MYLESVDLKEVYKIYRDIAGDFQCYFRATPFVSLKQYPNFKLNSLSNIKRENIKRVEKIESLLDEKSIIILDLSFNDSLEIGRVLNNRFKSHIILTMNFLFNEFGIVGNLDNISNLINTSKTLEKGRGNIYTFVLDNNRFLDNNPKLNKDQFNNQYEVTDEDLPSLEIIKKYAFNKVLIVTDNIKEDLNGYINYLKGNVDLNII